MSSKVIEVLKVGKGSGSSKPKKSNNVKETISDIKNATGWKSLGTGPGRYSKVRMMAPNSNSTFGRLNELGYKEQKTSKGSKSHKWSDGNSTLRTKVREDFGDGFIEIGVSTNKK